RGKGIKTATRELLSESGLTFDSLEHRLRKFYHTYEWDSSLGIIPTPKSYYLSDVVVKEPVAVETEYVQHNTENKYEFTKFIPVSIKLDKKETKKVDSSHLKRAVILPDIQAGFRRDWLTGKMVSMHDRQCLDLALQIIEDIQPHHVVYNGDNLDLAEQSLKFAKSPDFIRTTQAAAVELAWHYAKVRQSVGDETKIDVIA